MAAWREAWLPRPSEMFILVEDDAELGRHWYRWLVTVWRRYGARPEVAAVSLRSSRTGLGARRPETGELRLLDMHSLTRPRQLFLYQLGSFFCVSPRPDIWQAFMAEYSNMFGPNPPNFISKRKIHQVSVTKSLIIYIG